MTNRIATDVAHLAKVVNKLANQGMTRQASATAKAVMEEGKRQVEEVVYSVYTPDPNNPNSYERTGLLRESWTFAGTPEGLTVYNNRPMDGSRDPAQIVVDGGPYEYDFEYATVPRDFI